MTAAVQNPPRNAAATPIDINHELTAGFAHRYIRFKSRQIIGRHGISRADRADLDHDMKLRLLRRFRQFDPQKSDWEAFVVTVVERHVATILQAQQRQKRLGAGTEVSLSEETFDEEGFACELGDQVSLDHVARITGDFDRSDLEWLELDHDIEAALETLPDPIRELCERLKHDSIAATADAMGVPRSTLMSLLRRLRPTFERLGLSAFLTTRDGDADDECDDESENLSE
ncbi:MAG: RNA polymerase sigma factor [Planctomycetaceae bacterium]